MYFYKRKQYFKMGSRPGSLFGLEDKPLGCKIFGGFTVSPHPHKQETRGLKMDYNGIMISGCVAVFVREMCNDY